MSWTHPDKHLKKLKKSKYADFIPPHFQSKLEKLWTQYKKLALRIDRLYEKGEDEKAWDLEEKAEIVHQKINSILEEIDEGAEELWHGGEETKEFVGESLDEELAWKFSEYLWIKEYNPRGREVEDWVRNIRATIEDHAFREILQDTLPDKKERIDAVNQRVREMYDSEIISFAKEAYDQKQKYIKRHRERTNKEWQNYPYSL